MSSEWTTVRSYLRACVAWGHVCMLAGVRACMRASVRACMCVLARVFVFVSVRERACMYAGKLALRNCRTLRNIKGK